MDELKTSCRYLYEYREACVIGITETWLDNNIPDSAVDIPGFHNIRYDRTEQSGKSKGGGNMIYLNELWCNNVTVKKSLCTPDIELLSISTRPFYLPREFSNVFITLVYIPPSAVKENALSTVNEHVNILKDEKPDALHMVMGDVNQCDLRSVLHGYQQYVNCATRKEAKLDLFYCNIRNAFNCHQMSPCGNSDHKMLHLRPIYKPKLKQSKPQKMVKTAFSEESIDKLCACFDITDWDLFVADSANDVNELTDVVTSYINFCCDMLLEKKEIKIYPNRNPWMTPEVRQAVIDKHAAHKTPDYHDKLHVLNQKIKTAKDNHKTKVEALFTSGDIKEAWKGMKELTGMNKRKKI